MVERFSVKGWSDDHIQFADPDGKWVRYSDYAALEAQLVETQEKLIEANNKLIRQNEAISGTSAAKEIKEARYRYPKAVSLSDLSRDIKNWTDGALLSRILSALEPAAPEGQQPVAWQWRQRAKRSDGTWYDWSDWRDGRMPELRTDAYECHERPLYTRPAEQAVTEAMVEAAQGVLHKYVEDRVLVYSALKAALEPAAPEDRQEPVAATEAGR